MKKGIIALDFSNHTDVLGWVWKGSKPTYQAKDHKGHSQRNIEKLFITQPFFKYQTVKDDSNYPKNTLLFEK